MMESGTNWIKKKSSEEGNTYVTFKVEGKV